MNFRDPTKISKSEYKDLVDLISVPNSPVGIDAQYTHAIVITYLQQISQRLEKLEKILTPPKTRARFDERARRG